MVTAGKAGWRAGTRDLITHTTRAAMAALVIALGALPAAVAAQEVEAERLSLERLLETFVSDDGPPAMGALVIRDGRIAEQAVVGVRRRGDAAGVQADDLWHLGSDTKAITAALIARLVEKGRLSWTTPLDQLLPGMAAGMRPEYRDVTLVDLLTHRAALPEAAGPDDPFFRAFMSDPRPLPEQRRDWVTRSLSLAPAGEKRGEPQYSNTGFLLAAVIAEEATGRSFEDLLFEEVLRPLRMSTATFSRPGPRELSGHVAGRVAAPAEANPPMWNPAGGLRLSLRDWAIFCIDQMNGAEGRGRLLGQASYRTLQSASHGMAMGWMVAPRFAGRQGPVLNHAGSDGTWFALAALLPETGDGVLVAVNSETGGGDVAAFQTLVAVLQTLSEPEAEGQDQGVARPLT